MATQEAAQSQFTTQHIQQKLEENYDLLLKLVAANQKSLDPAAQAQVDQWSKQLQENLMNLAGQADKSAAGQQSQTAAAVAAAQPSAAPAGVAGVAGVAVAAQPTASTGSSVSYKP